jgi:centromere protein I
MLNLMLIKKQLSPPTVSELTTYTTRLSPPLSLPLLFAPSLSPVLSNLGNTHLRAIEDAHEDEIEKRHAGPVTPKSLESWRRDGGLGLTWADYKTGVLLDLRGRGVSGLWALMRITIKALEGMGEGVK